MAALSDGVLYIPDVQGFLATLRNSNFHAIKPVPMLICRAYLMRWLGDTWPFFTSVPSCYLLGRVCAHRLGKRCMRLLGRRLRRGAGGTCTRELPDLMQRCACAEPQIKHGQREALRVSIVHRRH